MKAPVEMEEHERAPTLLAFGYHFVLMCCYYIIQPVRDTLGVEDVDKLPHLFMASLVVMIAANPLFSMLVKRYPPSKFIPIVYRFFNLNLIGFYLCLTFVRSDAISKGFFLWVGIFNLFAISVFWSFVANVFDSRQGKRLYGFIGAGGTAGQLIGSAVTWLLAKHLGPLNMLLIAIVLLEVAVWTVKSMAHFTLASEKAASEAPRKEGRSGGPLDGVKAVIESPYLIGICLYMFLYSYTSSFLYFGRSAAVAANVTDTGGAAAFFAGSNLAVGLMTLALQLFLTGRLMAGLGVSLALSLVPLWTAAGFTALALIPSLTIFALFDVSRKTMNYAVARPARELLYTVVSRDEKYASKSFIDTFIYRAGDALASAAYGMVNLWVLAPRPDGSKPPAAELVQAGRVKAMTVIPFALLWLAIGFWLGRMQKRKAEETEGAEIKKGG